jgi:hypothetical protein
MDAVVGAPPVNAAPSAKATNKVFMIVPPLWDDQIQLAMEPSP